MRFNCSIIQTSYRSSSLTLYLKWIETDKHRILANYEISFTIHQRVAETSATPSLVTFAQERISGELTQTLFS